MISTIFRAEKTSCVTAKLPAHQEPNTATRFCADNPKHAVLAAELLLKNYVGLIGFNGVYGLFTNADSKLASNRILKIKNRPNDKNLVLVSAPEHIHEHVDFSKVFYPREKIINLQKYVHALGVILPASPYAPGHLVKKLNNLDTILSIWTEYNPLRRTMENFRLLGGRALAGTSANKNRQPSHFDSSAAYEDFKFDVDFTIESDYSKLPEIRRRSTSILDLTQRSPRIHRLGNISCDEIREALLKFKFPDLKKEEISIIVKPRLS